MSSSAHRDLLPEHPDPDLIDYRPVSGWAMAALLLGLTSILALVHPLLWCLPIAGAVVSLIALRRIERPGVKLLGRKAALVGLAFSVIYGIAAPVRLKTHEHWLAARAERLADEFLTDLRTQQLDRAFALMLRSVEKASSHRPTAGEKTDSEPQQDARQVFFSEQPVATLLTLGPQAHAVRLQTAILPPEDVRQPVGVLYRVEGGAASNSNPLEVLIYVEQIIDGEGQERWWITRVATPPPARVSM
jgi:hypothetical protein